MADYNTIQWPSHSTKCIIQESGQDGRTIFVDRDIWIKMTNKHKKSMWSVFHIHTWVSPQAGQVRTNFGIRAPHSIQYFVEESLGMPTDLFFYRHNISSLTIYLNALAKSVIRSVTLSVFSKWRKSKWYTERLLVSIRRYPNIFLPLFPELPYRELPTSDQ